MCPGEGVRERKWEKRREGWSGGREHGRKRMLHQNLAYWSRKNTSWAVVVMKELCSCALLPHQCPLTFAHAKFECFCKY